MDAQDRAADSGSASDALMPARPIALPPQWENIPQALRDLPAWVVWRYELRGTRWTKPPCRAKGGGFARTDDPATWADFATARAAMAHGADGIGIVITQDLVGVDLDHVIEADTGQFEPWASEIVDRFRGCHVERSPGGDGLRIFCRGTVRHSGKSGPDNRLEVYGSNSPRYLTVTGHRIADGDVIDAQAALDWLHDTYFAARNAGPTAAERTKDRAPDGSQPSDEEVLRRVRGAANGPKFMQLWAGDSGTDPSAADASLLAILAFWTRDRAQLDRLFRRSGLMRAKWDEKRGANTYGERTIDAVLAMGGATYEASDTAAAGAQAASPQGPQPLPPELPPVLAFPLDALPDAFRPWVGDVAERMQCPAEFVAVPMLVAAASLVARHVAIRPQAQTDWTERGNLWAMLVGRPGLMKSPALNAALAPMRKLEATAAEAHKALMKDQEIVSKVSKLKGDRDMKIARAALSKDPDANLTEFFDKDDAAPPVPARVRYMVNDATYESLGQVLEENPDGVLSVRDELRSLLLHLSSEEQATARGFYLQAWSGGHYVFDRVIRGSIAIEDIRLSMVGSIQPGPLGDLIQRARRGVADDGMLERFLVAWPDSPGAWREVDRWPDTSAKQSAWGVIERLSVMSADPLGVERELDLNGRVKGPPFLRFAPDARDAFREWRAEWEAKIQEADGEGLEGALSKFRHHVPALALVIHVVDAVSRGVGGPVSLKATLSALELADYFESHTRRLRSAARRARIRAARSLLAKARAGSLPDPFSARDVYRPQWSGLTDKEAISDALDMLVAHGWLVEASIASIGRPTTVYALTEGARHG